MKLIMRADDLGFSEAVNLGIYKAVKDGVITSVGIMTNMEQAYAGYELLKDFDLSLIHILLRLWERVVQEKLHC